MSRELAAKRGHSGFASVFAHTVKSLIESRGTSTSQAATVLDGLPDTRQSSKGLIASASQVSTTLNAAALALFDEHVGICLGMHMAPSCLGSLGYAAMAAPCGLDAVRLYEELQQLFMSELFTRHWTSGAQLHTQVDGRPCLSPDSYPFWSFLLVFRLKMIRGACGRHVVPDRVVLPCQPPRCDRALREFVGCSVQFRGGAYGEVFQLSWLHHPNPQSSPEIYSVMAAMARREWREACDADAWLISSLKNGILDALDKGAAPTLGSLAPNLAPPSQDSGAAVGMRQLQRKLAALRISYRDLVAEVRKERALMQLRSTNRPLVDIAVESGYAELSSFHRAVRRWTGLTPMDIRNAGVALDA